MRSGLLILALCAAALACGDAGVGYATSRVDDLFSELQEGQREIALMAWNTGTHAVTGSVEAADDFERWCQEGGVSEVRSFTVGEGREVEGSNPPAVIVSGTVNGEPFEVRVIERRPIQWVEKPGDR